MATVGPETKARLHEKIELVINPDKIHLFNLNDGASGIDLTLPIILN